MEPRIYGPGHSLRSLLGHATGVTRMGADEESRKSVNICGDPWYEQNQQGLLIRFERSEAGPLPAAEQAPRRGELYVYVLVDHKSSPEKWVPFQENGVVEQLVADPRAGGSRDERRGGDRVLSGEGA